ncbi:glycosyltransferase, partial [Ornithinicoccus halotolerans]|uniref:glycosyltransferase n=1 Tax=Ornithinicoccus halotolerans TaxID=1748220 RepID=UPI0012959897
APPRRRRIPVRVFNFAAGPATMPLEAVHLPGRLGPAALAALYHRADAYVAPTRLESFGIAALEARVAGLPVAGLADSGLGEFVTDGVHGVLARDDADLAVRLAGLLADPAALAAMAERNRTTEPDQVWERVVPQVRRLYRSAPPTGPELGGR